MEGLFEALLQIFFEFVIEIVFEIVGEITFEVLSRLDIFMAKVNLPTAFPVSDEIIKLDIFN